MEPRAAEWRAADLVCRPVRAVDLQGLRALFDRPELRAYRRPAPAGTADPAAAELAADLQHWAEAGMGRFVALSGGGLAGSCGLTRKPGFAGWNLSCHLAAEFRGKGRATAMVRGLLALVPRLAPPRRVYGLVLPGNGASARLLEKVGFTQQGTVDYDGRDAALWVAPDSGGGQSPPAPPAAQ